MFYFAELVVDFCIPEQMLACYLFDVIEVLVEIEHYSNEYIMFELADIAMGNIFYGHH